MSPRSGAGQGQCPHADPGLVGRGGCVGSGPGHTSCLSPAGLSQLLHTAALTSSRTRPTDREGCGPEGGGTRGQWARGGHRAERADLFVQGPDARAHSPAVAAAGPRAGALPGPCSQGRAATRHRRPSRGCAPHHSLGNPVIRGASLLPASRRPSCPQRRGTKGTGQAGCQRGQRGLLSGEATALPSGHHRAGHSGLG